MRLFGSSIIPSVCARTASLCRLAAAGAPGNVQPACSKSLRPKCVQTASEATTRRGTSVRTKGFPNGGVMLSTWAAQPKGPPATIPAPFTRLEKAIWNWWAKNAPEDMPDTVMPAGSSSAKAASGSTRTFWWSATLTTGQPAQTSTVQTAPALLKKRSPVTTSLLDACTSSDAFLVPHARLNPFTAVLTLPNAQIVQRDIAGTMRRQRDPRSPGPQCPWG